MTAFTCSTGGDEYFDAKTGGSVIATLDSYTISAGTRLIVRTDTYACPNHTTAFGSLDTVSFSGQGGTLRFDPTYVRVIAYTAGSGNAPAYGTTITAANGTTGVFLGAWTNWLSEPIVPGNAIGATGFIKLGGVSTPGNFNAGALSGITATCSGADVQGWIEIRGPDAATITVPRVGKVESVEAWFEIGTTNGSRGQVIACPTCATNAGVFAGVWIETAVGSGVYEPYSGVGSTAALATWRTTDDMKVVWQTTSGIRIGSDGTNNVGYLPVTGLRVRIPAIILTNCTRTASGSGPRVLPNATIATRQEFVTTSAGSFDLRGCVSQWYHNFSQAYLATHRSCAINDALFLSEIAEPLDVDNVIVSPTQAQINTALQVSSCFAGGTVRNSQFNRFSLATSGNYVANASYVTNVAFSGNVYRSLLLRGNGSTSALYSLQAKNCTFTNETLIGARMYLGTVQNCTVTNLSYLDHTITTTTSATNPVHAVDVSSGCSGVVVDGMTLPIAAIGPYTGLVLLTACYNSIVKNIGTYASPLTLNASVTGTILNSGGNNDGIAMKRCYAVNTRTGPYILVNSDTNVLIENVAGDYADATVQPALNAVMKSIGITSALTGQTSTYGTHWITRFISTTAGFTEILCNEPTAGSATQCAVTGGVPQFNSIGQVLLTKVGDQVTWEMPFFAIGYTAFTNSAPTITGTNVTYSSGARWGNHDIEFQINTGSGYGGSWLALTAANFTAQTINATTGFKLKVRATCATASATNVITNMRVPMTTTNSAQGDSLYPLATINMTLTGLVAGSDVTILAAGTETVLATQEENAGTTFTYTYETPQSIDVAVYQPGYIPFFIRGYVLGSSNASLPCAQVADVSYLV